MYENEIWCNVSENSLVLISEMATNHLLHRMCGESVTGVSQQSDMLFIQIFIGYWTLKECLTSKQNFQSWINPSD